MKLSPHFSLRELTKSSLAERKGFSNEPSPEQLENLKALAEAILEPLRVSVGMPVSVNSGFRSLQLNKAVGGSPKSQHLAGEAADIEVFSFGNKNLAARIISLNLPFDQLILEGHSDTDPNKGWVHVSHKRAGSNRGEVLTATFINGKAKYSKGLG